jgi:hypothetical protein
MPGLPERALQTLLMLAIVVVISIVGLIPGQERVALGVELLIVALAYVAAVAGTVKSQLTSQTLERSWLIGRLVVVGFGGVPLVVGAVSVLAEQGGGLYWIAAGMIGAIFGGVANAWVLLVEIQR